MFIYLKKRCDCNGYSSLCDTTKIPFRCNCDTNSNTFGSMVFYYFIYICT